MGKKKRQADHSVRADEDSSDSIEENQTKTTGAILCNLIIYLLILLSNL